jgi:hypothetical protein
VYQRLLFGHRPLEPKLAKALLTQALKGGVAAPKTRPRAKRRAA